MNLISNHPFWSVVNGIPATYPSLKADIACDVVIIGGGITGAVAAVHLMEAGVSAVLIDKREIGTGSTSGSTALLQYEIDIPLCDLIEKIGLKAATRSYELCRESIGKLQHLVKHHKIDCSFECKPSLFLARSPRETGWFQEEFQLRRRMGIELDYLDERAIQKLFSFSRPAALFSRDGGQVDPHCLTHGLLGAGQDMGLEVYDRTEMVNLAHTIRGVTVTTKEGFVIKARRALVAAGFESKTLLRGDAGTLKSTYALVSEPLPEIPEWYQRSLIWESGSPYLYMRTTPEGRIIVGGEDESFVNGKRRDALISRKARTLTKKFGRLFPKVTLDVAYAWAGTFAETKDGLAYIGVHPRFPHVYFALGYGGNGITFSLIAAEIIRDLFLDRKNKDSHLFRFGR